MAARSAAYGWRRQEGFALIPRSWRLSAFVIVASTLLAACGAAPASAPASQAAPDKLTVGYSNKTGDNLAPWTAKEDRIFDKNRLDVDLELIAGGANTMSALLSGQLQLAQVGGSEVLSAAARGADLVVVATLSPVYPYVFMVSADIKSAADLKGKKVGISTPGGSADIATRQGLRRVGIDPEKDVIIVPVGSHETRTAALLSGALQGAVDDPPGTVKLEEKGLHPLFDLASQKLPTAQNVIAGQRPWVSAHREIVQRYVDSIVQAAVRIKRDKALAVRVLKQYFKSDDDHAMGVAADFYAKEVLPSLPYPELEQFAAAKAVLGGKSEKVRNFDVASILDRSFVQSAADRGLSK